MAEPLRVLILEDNPDDVELMVHELRRAGFDLEWVRVETRTDYLSRLDEKPNLILSDYALPQFTGVQALALMQERGLDIPFILVTGALEEVAIECMKQGASDYLLKDRLGRLGPSVKSALENHRLRTANRLAEKTLRLQAASLESAANAIVITNREGVIEWVNPAYVRLTGYAAEEAIGKTQRILKSGVQDEAFYQEMWDTILAGNVWHGEIVNQRKDGSLYTEEETITPLKDADGQITHFISVNQDITDRVRAEETLRESEALYRTLFDTSSAGIGIADMQGNLIFVNDAMLKMGGYTKEDVRTIKNVAGFYADPADREKVLSIFQNQGFVDHYEVQFKAKDGSAYDTLLSLRRITYQGKPAVYAQVNDIHERKQAEEALYLMAQAQRQIAQIDDLQALYQLVGEKIRELVGDVYVIVSTLDEQIQAMRVVGLHGFGPLYKELVARFKVDPARITYPLQDMTEEELRLFRSGRLEELEGGLYALLTRKVPRAVCDLVEKRLNISSVHTMSFVWHGLHFGGVSLLAKVDIDPYKDMIESIMNQAAISIKRIRAEEALRKSEAQYRDLVRYMGSGVDVYEAVDEGRDFIIKTMNPAGEKINQVRLAEVVGRSVREVFPGVDEFGWMAAVQQVYETGESIHLPPALYTDNRLSLWIDSYLYRLPTGEVVAVYDDVSRQAEAEKALVHERDLLHTLMDSVPELIYFKDDQSRFTRINRAQAAILGVPSPEAAVGKTDADFFPSELAQAALADEQEIIQTGEPLVGKVERIQHADGERRWVLTTKVPIVVGGETTGIVGVTRDITKLKQTEEALQRYTDRLSVLREIDLAILSTQSPVEIARRALELLDQLVPCLQSSITLFDFEERVWTRLAVHGEVEGVLEPGLRQSLDQFVTDWKKLRQGQVNVMRQLQGLSEGSPIREALLSDGVDSVAQVPLVFQSELIGTLNLASDTSDTFTEEYLEIAGQVAGQLAIAIQQARLAEQNQRHAGELESLRRVTLDITSQLDLDDLLGALVESAARLMKAESGGVYYYRPELDLLEWRVSYGATRIPIGSQIKRGEGLSGKVWETGEAMSVADYSTWPDQKEQYKSFGVHAIVAAPIRWGDEFLGVINVAAYGDSKRHFTEHDKNLLSQFAAQAAVAIQNARLYQELEIYSSVLEQAVGERTAELQQEKEQAEAILQSVADAIGITDSGGNILAVNPAFVQQTGYTEIEAVGQHIRVLSAEPADSPGIQEIVSASHDGHPIRIVTQIMRKDGNQFDAVVSMAPLNRSKKKGEARGFVIALHDVSTFKEVERLKDEFLSTAAHELRTPLTSIRGFSEILLTRDLPEDRQKGYLSTISDQATQLAQIIDDLLDISRLEAGRGLDLKLETVDMFRLVTEAVRPFADTSPDHHFELENPANDSRVMGDPFRLSQVLRNLISNAVKYSPDGGPVRIRTQIEGGDLAVSVQDEGIGMTPEQQGHLFERFYRADSASRSIGGTGLGLTICKLIVEGHGGQIRVVSEKDRGSTFTFILPLAQDQISETG